MRGKSILVLLAALASAPAGAQSVIPLDGVGRRDGPNARAAERPLGPNAQAAQRVKGANTVARPTDPGAAPTYFPSCSAARASQATPIRQGEPGYGRHLDRDGDGVACD